MTFRYAALLGLALIGLPAATSAQTPAACATRDAVVHKLTADFGETRQSIGLGHNNTLVEIFASPESGTWSIVVTTTQGVTCLVASGRAFETVAEALPNTDPDA